MVYLAVAIGGFLGACARYLVTEVLGTLHGFPIATLVINLCGSCGLTWFYTITMERLPVHPHVRTGIGTGFIGAFTTFSTLNIELWSLWRSGMWGWLGLYAAASYIGGILASIAGYTLAMRQSRLHTVSMGKDVDP